MEGMEGMEGRFLEDHRDIEGNSRPRSALAPFPFAPFPFAAASRWGEDLVRLNSDDREEEEPFFNYEFEEYEVDYLRKSHVFFNSYKCKICLTNFTAKDLESISCGCFYCKDCFTNYVKHQIQDNHSRIFFCPQHKIIKVDNFTLEKFCSEEDIMKYMDNEHKFNSFKYCKNGHKNCKKVYSVNCYYNSCEPQLLGKPQLLWCIVCNEQLEFNHKCKSLEDSKMLDTLSASSNFNPCPSCFILIQKTEGCNHLNCTNCKLPFTFKHLPYYNPRYNPHHNVQELHKIGKSLISAW